MCSQASVAKISVGEILLWHVTLQNTKTSRVTNKWARRQPEDILLVKICALKVRRGSIRRRGGAVLESALQLPKWKGTKRKKKMVIILIEAIEIKWSCHKSLGAGTLWVRGNAWHRVLFFPSILFFFAISVKEYFYRTFLLPCLSNTIV